MVELPMTRPTYTTPEGRATRDAIIDAAMRAFATRGYRGTSIDSVAAEVGVSRQGVLHHYPSKVALLIAVLERRDELDGARAAQAIEQHGGSVLETLQALMRRTPEDQALGRLFTILSAESTDPDHPAHDYFVARYDRARTLTTEWMAAEQAAGRLPAEVAPDRLASLILAILDGLQLQNHLAVGSVDFDATLSDLMRLLRP